MRLAALLLTLALAGCTTTNYGTKPQPVPGEPDVYKFKMFTGGLAGGDSADEAIAKDLEAFRSANGFARYRIVRRQFNAIPSSYEYFVSFER